MPTTYTDQFFTFDPFEPLTPGDPVTWVTLPYTDNNDDGDIDRFNFDNVDGSDIWASWPGDTVTLNVPGKGLITYTGITFYLRDGRDVFTPTDGQVLENGTFVSTTWVFTQGPALISDLGPPCFTPGTLLSTPTGPCAIETLAVGDLVETMDNGMQAIRWIGRRTVPGRDAFAPIRFAPGAIGNDRPLLVSPQHRMLVCGWRAELYLGVAEALVPAKHLVDGDRVVRAPCPTVTYLHLMFDGHEIVFAEGAAAESFFPGDWIAGDASSVGSELAALFPELDLLPQAYEMARPVPRAFEARLVAGS